ncbi:MAG: hypothetical protein J7L22_11710 [Candidatus Marinimicrobia bacterium]|nr:hypothetical protein [Candidatus Neomarinimicrobiota bacterium]
MECVFEIIETVIGLGRSAQTGFIITTIIILVLWLLRSIFRQIIYCQTEDVKTRYIWR